MLANIHDSGGKTRLYEVSELPQANNMARRWMVLRLDTGNKHEVFQTLPGRWGCTCRGFYYRKTCKHTIHFQENDMTTKTKDQPTTTIDAEVIENKPMVPVQQSNGGSQQILPASTPQTTRYPFCGSLAKALASAQMKCKSVSKDSHNKFHNYDYASSEGIIEEAKAALAETGLALVPIELNVNGTSKEGIDRYELERKFLLIHESGESLPIVMHWPICPEKGRPLDKATAIADTTSLAYFLRDLLQMPRVKKEDDMSARQDEESPAPPQKQQSNRPPEASPGFNTQVQPPARDFKPGMITEEQFKYLGERLKGKGDYTRALLAALGLKGFGEVSQAWWLFIRACVDHAVNLDWLKAEVMKGRVLNALSDDEMSDAVKRVRTGT